MDLKEGHGRDILIALAVVGSILLGLTLYTGNWPPPVVVESNSMMHVDAQEYQGNFGDSRADGVPYGRIGTIDPGDLVLVKKKDSADEVSTYADGGDEHYGMAGEVIVYYRFGERGQTPIIHRAMTYVERTEGPDGQPQFHVRWSPDWDPKGSCELDDDGRGTCTFGDDGVTISELGLNNKVFQNSGFITKGDNVVGNQRPDQVLGIMSQPVKIEWVQGVSRGELPWFGLIKLMFTNPPSKNAEVQDHPYYLSIGKMTAPKDLWVMLVVGLATVALAPLGIDVGIHQFKQWRASREDGPAERDPYAPAPPGPHEPGPLEEPEDDAVEDEDEPPPRSSSGTRVDIDLE